MARVDTHQLIEELVKSGLSKKPAEILGRAFLDNSSTEEFISKGQFNHLEKEQTDIKTDLAVIKQTMVTKADIEILRTEMLSIKIEILKWMIPMLLTVIGLIIATFFK